MGKSNKLVVSKASSSLDIVETTHQEDAVPVEEPIVSSYNDPMLDIVERLKNLSMTRNGVKLPSIVMVGDKCSGKSSIMESLARIRLPRGKEIRVPLVMKLQNSSSPEPEIWLEFNDKRVDTDEEHVAEAIRIANETIAGSGRGIRDTPLTLHLKKEGVPDLTMVNLPGITRVPVNGQPQSISKQISSMIMKYIKPKESIILNVLSAAVYFTTCESIFMSRQVDKTGERTLAVVTKGDMAPEGLLQNVMADDVIMGLGYVCVRNRIGDETFEEAQREEEVLFSTNPMLSMIDKDMVGISVLVDKLTRILGEMTSICLSEVEKKINEKTKAVAVELSEPKPAGVVEPLRRSNRPRVPNRKYLD